MSSDSGSRSQQIKLSVAILVFVIAGVWAWATLGGPSPTKRSAKRQFYCVETQKFFEYTIKMGDTKPYPSPHSGKNTGYPAEACNWTKDAGGLWARKEEPTWVLVAKEVDPSTEEKTYCPDCGRLVVRHNPFPTDELIAKANSGGDDEEEGS